MLHLEGLRVSSFKVSITSEELHISFAGVGALLNIRTQILLFRLDLCETPKNGFSPILLLSASSDIF